MHLVNLQYYMRNFVGKNCRILGIGTFENEPLTEHM